jgi:hypothetical protein
MWWKVLLRVAVALGIDKWAERKASELITKGIDKLTKRSADLAKTFPKSIIVNGQAVAVEAFKKAQDAGAR